jgi:hypothetical protein
MDLPVRTVSVLTPNAIFSRDEVSVTSGQGSQEETDTTSNANALVIITIVAAPSAVTIQLHKVHKLNA